MGFWDILTAFDWITPVLAEAQDITGGPHKTLLIPADAISGRDVQRLLRRAGVKTWGVMIPSFSHTLMVTVQRSQLQRAQAALQGAGVPLLNQPEQQGDTGALGIEW